MVVANSAVNTLAEGAMEAGVALHGALVVAQGLLHIFHEGMEDEE